MIYFYNYYDEGSQLEVRSVRVEFLTTMRYIERSIKTGDRVLEIGVGTGRCAHTLARRGYTVDALELVEHNIEVFKRNTIAGEDISIAQGNALDLSSFPNDRYDITLLLGPPYHLYTTEDKQQAIQEAIRVAKPGGIIFAAYVISDGCLIDEGFNRGNINVAEYVKPVIRHPIKKDVMEEGQNDTGTKKYRKILW